MTQPKSDGPFREGTKLFNRGHFFEAHEVWEQEWKMAEGEARLFYQGMIQAAAALCHVQRGNYAGAVSVYLKSSSKLAQFPTVWMGIKLGHFRTELKRYFVALKTPSDPRCGNCPSAVTGETAPTQSPPTIRWAPCE
jgi:predicted metal-dependent hydrolase